MKKLSKTLLLAVMSVLAALFLSGCEKIPNGQGELIVCVNNTKEGSVICISPYSDNGPGPAIVTSKGMRTGSIRETFVLNVGNYMVYCGIRANCKAVQIVEGETVTVYLNN
ncbi:MAG: hypothetical protein IAC23_05920 [Bacteroidetes bacterium]|uniref:Lipoprotein n=1 Tax=Candidatus Cryptobacteroides merdavium TaxID=2840769 RepID=A0A9D9EC60_9BACT|nr:hypothetical protein [Candidatus Cryptobacteroides merdavium]